MSEIMLVNNEYITMKYLVDIEVIYHTIHRPMSDQPLRDALLKGFNALRIYGVCKWVSDDRKNGPMTPEDREWGMVNLNQRAMEAGWKYWALVAPSEVVAAGSLFPTMTALQELGLRMAVFSDLEEAFAWIEPLDC